MLKYATRTSSSPFVRSHQLTVSAVACDTGREITSRGGSRAVPCSDEGPDRLPFRSRRLVGDAGRRAGGAPHARSTNRSSRRLDEEPDLASSTYVDVYGNRCRRLELPEGASTVAYDALVEVDPEPEPTPGNGDAQHRIEDLPDHLLHWLLPSRYAESDLLTETAWSSSGRPSPARSAC